MEALRPRMIKICNLVVQITMRTFKRIPRKRKQKILKRIRMMGKLLRIQKMKRKKANRVIVHRKSRQRISNLNTTN